ncbi:MAG: three-Cys-motif partner protein TcmP [Candidatus Paceibacterota bacterium]
MKEKDSKKMMLSHSEAKVKLLESYLSVYLNILNRAKGINSIHLFDLFAGEGIYDNKKKGSALTILEVIKNHYFSNNKSCPEISVLINEPGESEVEKGVLKIDRIKREAGKIYNPDGVNRRFTNVDYDQIVDEVIDTIKSLKTHERGLIFIDPWGYSQVKFAEIQSLMRSKKVELILFLPIYFMYRFANKSLSDEDFPSGAKLEILLKEIFQDKNPDLSDQEAFISSIKEAFRKQSISEYVDTFVIERAKGQLFSLFFFTNHPKGAEKMLDAKWKLDDSRGKGFRLEMNADQKSLFTGISGSNYKRLLNDFIKRNKSVSNMDIYEFGLRKGFLPKHSNQVLNQLKKEGIVELISKDKQPVRGNYIGNYKRKIEFSSKTKEG